MKISESSKEALISDFLIYSCAYYKYGKSLISDREFDIICDKLKDLRGSKGNWDSITHMHKHLIDYEMLNTTSAYNIKEYPTIVEMIVRDEIRSKA